MFFFSNVSIRRISKNQPVFQWKVNCWCLFTHGSMEIFDFYGGVQGTNRPRHMGRERPVEENAIERGSQEFPMFCLSQRLGGPSQDRRKWLGSPPFMSHEWPFGRGTTRSWWDLLAIVAKHLLTGMILQVLNVWSVDLPIYVHLRSLGCVCR